jgi:internalin A
LDISAIKNCTKLTKVYLNNANIQSISGLEFLNNLQELILKNNNISNLKPLENLTNLTKLNLENNAISDTATYTDTDGSVKTINNINLLANLNKSKNGKLEKLYLSGNDNIINWSPLSSLTWSAKSGW